jgi:glycosyltransferase involved in cell wall biosynthesis
MKILLIEPFFTGSHQAWTMGYHTFSQHQIQVLSLPGRHWKWRMHGGALSLAKQFLAMDFHPDLIVASDMLDLPTFLSLTRQKSATIPTAIYFHENQITYPWSNSDPDLSLGRDNHYGFINYTSALVADAVFFNSDYHRFSFLNALPDFLKQFPDYRELDNVISMASKCQTLYLGVDLEAFKKYENGVVKNKQATLLWNHRWEYDKNPTGFFKALFQLKKEGIRFNLILLGENYKKVPPIFEQAKTELAAEIIQYGKVIDFASYAQFLWQADILPVTNNQDFFGQSVVEAIYCNCYPILPRRLAYPEHIPTELQFAHFYEKEAEFYEKLKQAILNIEEIRKEKTQNFVAAYDWRKLAPIYDAKMETLIHE